MKKWETIQGIYIHIPFCLQKCLYCDFASFAQQNRTVMEEYTQCLCKEILAYKGSLPVNSQATIYFGGGTPSVLPLECLLQIVEALQKAKLWQEPSEATIEANPGTLNLEKLQQLKAVGFNRISMGIQSLQDEELKSMGRIHDAAQALASLAEAREAGFKRINGDLIYGYPGQSESSVLKSVQGLLKAGLTHISVYGLTVEECTPLAKLLAEGKLTLPPEDTAINMYETITAYLPKQGLARYEISNYAAPGQESLHNLVYWHYLPYLGFGLGATGFDGQKRLTNPALLKDYLEGKPGLEEELTPEIRLSEGIFMGLRLAQGVSIPELEERFKINFWQKYGNIIEESTKQGLLNINSQQYMALTKRGMELGNVVFERFL